jgi:hypothetical protein
LIPQPPLDKLSKLTRSRLAPDSQRVDLVVATFSHPTTITNPLFPISNLHAALLVGKLGGVPWRAETTLLPDTKTIEWNGQQVETLQSQFVAYLNGRIFEVAVDLYAEADDGSVWYFGEDAFTYKKGRVVDTEDTWLAGVTGPPAMILPGHPHVGDVYRTENVPGLVFEQVTIKDLGHTVNGPIGPVTGAMIGEEVHMDETRVEAKTFAPGNGEFFSGGGRTFEANALAVPIDALPQPAPAELETLSTGAVGILDAARSQDWRAATAALDDVNTAWDAFRTGEVPSRLAAQMGEALDQGGRAVGARDPGASALAALEIARVTIDLELRYRPPVEVDMARFELWTRHLQADAAAGKRDAVVGDVATLDWIRDRIPLAGADARGIDDQLRSLEGSAEAGELTAASDAAARLRDTLAGLKPAT